MLRLGWMTTGRGEGSLGFLKTVLSSIENGSLDAAIEFVFSNREHGEGEGSDMFFNFVQDRGIPLVNFSSSRFRNENGGGEWIKHREEYHVEVLKKLANFSPGISVLAGYLLITGREMIKKIPMINLHPALPEGPSGTWRQVIAELIQNHADESGVMVHSVTDVLDEGPILSWCRYPIKGGLYDPLWAEMEVLLKNSVKKNLECTKLFHQIREDGIMYERPLLLETLIALASGGINFHEGTLTDRNGDSIGRRGLCMDAKVRQNLDRHDLYADFSSSLEAPLDLTGN